jgi:hypothetical protein
MPCIYTEVRKLAQYETRASFKGRLVTHIVRVMSALPGGFNGSTQHLLILLEEEVCDGGDCTDMVHAAAEG